MRAAEFACALAGLLCLAGGYVWNEANFAIAGVVLLIAWLLLGKCEPRERDS